MAIKTPIRTVFDGSNNATGLAEFQSGEFIGLTHGGIGASLSIGSAGQVLKVNSGASALEFGNVEAVLNIDGMTDGSSVTIVDGDDFAMSDGGTEKKVNASQIATYVQSEISSLPLSQTALSAGTGITLSTNTLNVDAAQTGITSLLATDIKIGEDDQTKIDFETADEIHFYAANAEQVFVSDGVFGPQTDSDVDLGTNAQRFKDAYIDSLTTTANAAVGGNLTVTGDFTVNGTTTTVNSSVTTVDDPVFTLGGDSAPGSDDNKDRGVEFRYHTGSAAKIGFFGFDDSTGKFTFIPDASNSSEVFSGTAGTIVATTFEGNLTGNVTGNTSGTAATVTGAAQSNITSLGTLTTLTVDSVIVNGATIGHTDDTDLITLADGIATVAGELSVTTLDIGGTNVTSTAAELNLVDGITAGTVIASKAIITDSNKDITGGRNITISGELDAATLDISGNTDIDGTLVVNDTTDASSSTTGSVIIDGGAGIAKKLYVGSDLDVTGNAVIDGNLTVSGNFDLGQSDSI
jgi:hypothetical protein